LTPKVAVMVCFKLPLVPEMVRVELPAGVAPDVEMFNVALPEARELGLNVPCAPAGRPLTLSETLSLNTPEGVSVTVYVVPVPAGTVREPGVAEREKSP